MEEFEIIREIIRGIIADDSFVRLEATAQALYFHMLFDSKYDDGQFVCISTQVAMFKAHADKEDFKTLCGYGFIEQRTTFDGYTIVDISKRGGKDG